MGLFHSKVERRRETTSSAPKGNVNGTGPVAFHGARDTQIHGGTFNVAENIHHTINHFHAAAPPDGNLIPQIQDWLAPDVNFQSIQIETFKKRTPDTGRWLLEGTDFQEWLDGKGGILWGIGMPGAGKTIVASIVIDYLETRVEELDPGEMSLAYAFSRYTEEISVEQILTGLAGQQLRRHPSLVQFIEPLYRRHENGKTKPTQKELVDLLAKFLKMFKLSFYILDGVDEARKDVQFDLVKALRSIKAHFFLTSRPLDSLESELPEAKIFRITAHDKDIILLVAKVIKDNPEFRLLLADETFKQEVIAKILEKSAGMFLHASLQLKALEECVNEDEIRSKLDELPAGLDGMYDITISRIEKQPSNRVVLAKRILALVVHAERPLSVEELQYAAAADLETHRFSPGRIVSEAILLAVCCGLIYVENQNDGLWMTKRTVRLIHFTAKDALHQILLKDFPSPHAFLTSTCISRLISCNFQESDIKDSNQLTAAFNNNPFLRYAYDHCHSHACQCDPQLPAIFQFLEGCQSFPLDLDLHWMSGFYDGALVRGTGIHVAAAFGFLHTSSNIPDPNLLSLGHGWTPLLVALRFSALRSMSSSTRSAMILLDLPGIDVNAAEPRYGFTPLILASQHGYPDVVGRLLEFPDIKVNARDKHGETALMYAARNGHRDVVNLLLQHERIDMDIADDQGLTPPMLAHMKYHTDVVQLLLAYTPPTHLDSRRHAWAEFMQASRQGRLDRLEQLLESSDVPINDTDQNGYTALILASFYGNESVIQRLLQLPTIQVNLEAKNGHTALVVAADRGYSNIVRHLLASSGIEVNKPGQPFRPWYPNQSTALILASEDGSADIVEQLLQHSGINVNATDMYGRTPLMSASSYGTLDVVKRLLQHPGIDVNATDTNGWTALMSASGAGYLAVVEELLQFPGIQIELASPGGYTALSLAEVSHDPTIVRLIREALVKQRQPTEL